MFIFVSAQAACIVKEPGTLGETPSGGGAHDGSTLRSGSRRGSVPTPTRGRLGRSFHGSRPGSLLGPAWGWHLLDKGGKTDWMKTPACLGHLGLSVHPSLVLKRFAFVTTLQVGDLCAQETL